MPRFGQDCAFPFFFFLLFFFSFHGCGCFSRLPFVRIQHSQSRRGCSEKYTHTNRWSFCSDSRIGAQGGDQGQKVSIMQQLGKEENGWTLDPC